VKWIHNDVGWLASTAVNDFYFVWPLDFNDISYVGLILISLLIKQDR
jgi:hypothetical protein